MAGRSTLTGCVAWIAFLMQALGPGAPGAQSGGTRDLADPITPPGEPRPFHIEFPADGEAPTPGGQELLDRAVSALQGPAWKDRPVLLEVCAGAEGEGDVRKRAEWVRAFLVERHAVDERSLYIGVFERGASPSGECAAQGDDDPHASDQRVAIRPWERQQLADLAGSLWPRPVVAQVTFWHRARGAVAFGPLEDGASVASGDEFQVFLSVGQEAYAYVFHRGSGGTWVCLLPGRLGRNPLVPGRPYWLPDPDRGFALDETPGQEETYVYVGAGPHPLLETWAKEGVPWEVVSAQNVQGAAGQVRVTSPARHMDWYRRISFEHREGPPR